MTTTTELLGYFLVATKKTWEEEAIRRVAAMEYEDALRHGDDRAVVMFMGERREVTRLHPETMRVTLIASNRASSPTHFFADMHVSLLFCQKKSERQMKNILIPDGELENLENQRRWALDSYRTTFLAAQEALAYHKKASPHLSTTDPHLSDPHLSTIIPDPFGLTEWDGNVKAYMRWITRAVDSDCWKSLFSHPSVQMSTSLPPALSFPPFSAEAARAWLKKLSPRPPETMRNTHDS